MLGRTCFNRASRTSSSRHIRSRYNHIRNCNGRYRSRNHSRYNHNKAGGRYRLLCRYRGPIGCSRNHGRWDNRLDNRRERTGRNRHMSRNRSAPCGGGFSYTPLLRYQPPVLQSAPAMRSVRALRLRRRWPRTKQWQNKEKFSFRSVLAQCSRPLERSRILVRISLKKSMKSSIPGDASPLKGEGGIGLPPA